MADLNGNFLGASCTGTMKIDRGKFGFIAQDSGEADMFVICSSCDAFGRQAGQDFLPPLGTRVAYDVVIDQKTRKPRAENVRPETILLAGTMHSIKGKYGYIEQDSGEDRMFVIPSACEAFGRQAGQDVFPPIGTRVVYEIVLDERTGRPRAHNVQPEDGPIMSLVDDQMSTLWGSPTLNSAWGAVPTWSFTGKGKGKQNTPSSVGAGHNMFPHFVSHAANVTAIPETESWVSMQPAFSGTMHIDKGKFGYILQDSGEEDMFVLPSVCEAFGRGKGQDLLPPIGTRVMYNIVCDERTGRPRAHNVQPEIERPRLAKRPRTSISQHGPSPPMRIPQPISDGQFNDPSAFITTDDDRQSGSMAKHNEKFGFIQTDAGGELMFVMPSACEAFGRELPPLGCRVTFSITVDKKTGRPRAEHVLPEE